MTTLVLFHHVIYCFVQRRQESARVKVSLDLAGIHPNCGNKATLCELRNRIWMIGQSARGH